MRILDMPSAERLDEIQAYLLRGWTYEEIGAELSPPVTRQRIEQIVREHNLRRPRVYLRRVNGKWEAECETMDPDRLGRWLERGLDLMKMDVRRR